jgi:hypothetical protein
VKVTYKSTPTASQEAQELELKDEMRKRSARELCSSPPPAPETVMPTPFGKKNNYFQLLKVDEEDDEKNNKR